MTLAVKPEEPATLVPAKPFRLLICSAERYARQFFADMKCEFMSDWEAVVNDWNNRSIPLLIGCVEPMRQLILSVFDAHPSWPDHPQAGWLASRQNQVRVARQQLDFARVLLSDRSVSNEKRFVSARNKIEEFCKSLKQIKESLNELPNGTIDEGTSFETARTIIREAIVESFPRERVVRNLKYRIYLFRVAIEALEQEQGSSDKELRYAILLICMSSRQLFQQVFITIHYACITYDDLWDQAWDNEFLSVHQRATKAIEAAISKSGSTDRLVNKALDSTNGRLKQLEDVKNEAFDLERYCRQLCYM